MEGNIQQARQGSQRSIRSMWLARAGHSLRVAGGGAGGFSWSEAAVATLLGGLGGLLSWTLYGRGAAPQGVAGSGGGPLVAVGQGENVPRLVHLTNAAGRVGIETSGQIVGRHDIFAVPEAVAQKSTVLKVLRTGLPPSRTAQAVPIPEAATQLFRCPVPIGLYSAWKYFGGTYYAAPGTINTITGAFTSGSSLIGPRLLIYGPDGAIYVVIAIGGGIYWYAASMENK
jgi:hypothetical protein